MSSRRPPGPAISRRPGSSRPSGGRPLRALFAGAVTAVVLVGTAVPALAAPAPPPNPTDGQISSAQQQKANLATEVGKLNARVMRSRVPAQVHEMDRGPKTRSGF